MNKFIIPTFTEIQFDLKNPTLDMIHIEDIAHHLSLMNRYCGATKFPYSVAYHSICVSSFLPEELKLEGLLHDAIEAYVHDLTSPMKKLLRNICNDNMSSYDIAELGVQAVISTKFNLDYSLHGDLIKTIDLRMATTEIFQLVNYFPSENWAHEYSKAAPLNIFIEDRSWRDVEQEFLNLYERYRRI